MRFPWSRRAEIEEEVRVHLRMAAAARIERGDTSEVAERNARREFGNELLIRDVTYDLWRWTALETLLGNFRYALRQMRRSPGFAVVAILTLAFGLGATTAMFSIVNGVLLDPLPFPDSGRLYLAQDIPPTHLFAGNLPINARHFSEWRERCHSCEQVALLNGLAVTLSSAGEPERLPGLSVSYNFFRTMGIQPVLGRDFLPAEELPGNFRVVILSDVLWRTRFHSDASILGRKILLNGEPNEVIGVMGPGLHLPRGRDWGAGLNLASAEPLVFRPLGLDVSRASPGKVGYSYAGVVRLKQGIAPRQTIGEFNAIIADFIREYQLGSRPTLIALRDQMTGGVGASLWLLLGAIAAVLLIVCVNIGNLMLVRTSGRYREAGIRVGLGARRSSLFGLVLSEAGVLAAAGCGIGLLLANAGLKLFVAAAPLDLPRVDEIHIDFRVFVFAAAAGLASTLICGLFPAWRLSRVDAYESLKASSSRLTEGRRELRLREFMVSLEVALSVVLLVAGGLLVRSFIRVRHLDAGFQAAHVITLDIPLVAAKYGDLLGAIRADRGRERFISEALRGLKSVPGVDSVGVASQIPLRGQEMADPLRDPDRPIVQERETLANFRMVSPDYWDVMGIRLEQGRLFRDSDRDRKVAVLSSRAAQWLWPNQNPIGKHVRLTADPAPGEVIGVVRDVRTGLEQEAPPTVYEPYWAFSLPTVSFVVRTSADPAAVTGGVRAVLHSIDPDLPIPQAKTMQQIVDESVAARRFETMLAAGFALAALALASLGVYGVIAFTVARRTPEIGIRIALGACAPQLAGMVLRQGMTPVLLGVAAGLGCALALGRFMGSQLYGVAPNDPLTISVVAIILLLVPAAACWVPARRAMRVDPMTALRFE